MKHSPDTIPIKCVIPDELLEMMSDFKVMVNHFMALGIQAKNSQERHYYPLVAGDESGKPKLIPLSREMRDNPINQEWFDKYYREKYNEKYHSHYLHSATAYATQLIKSWQEKGGDITATPYIRNPVARLDSSLFKIKRTGRKLKIRIVIAPRHYVAINAVVNHRHWNNWSKNREGELLIVHDGVRLCFTDETPVIKSKESVAYDFNMDRVVMARSDGELKAIPLTDAVMIQKAHRKKRISVQRTMRHNPVKGERLITKNSGREHARVEDYLHKTIHGKNNEILTFIGDRHLGIEDLRKTTQDILKTDNGKKFNAKMSNWIHGDFADIIKRHHPDSHLYYTRGTSKWCPFCNSKLTHPIWKQSKCPNCGLFDRDYLEAVSGLVRTNTKHKKGEPWALVHDLYPEPIETKLLQNSLLTNSTSKRMLIRGLSVETQSVCPECAILYPEVRSVIGVNNVMQENHNDVGVINAGLIVKSGNDANYCLDKGG